jgi:hypothetical protein
MPTEVYNWRRPQLDEMFKKLNKAKKGHGTVKEETVIQIYKED